MQERLERMEDIQLGFLTILLLMLLQLALNTENCLEEYQGTASSDSRKEYSLTYCSEIQQDRY
jgi:hypothetical protein